MRKPFATACMFALLGLHCAAAHAASEFKIVTASERGTYIQIGRDIATIVAPQADINLDVLPSAGSGQNVKRLRYEQGVKLAIVQSDVYQAFLDLARSGNRESTLLEKEHSSRHRFRTRVKPCEQRGEICLMTNCARGSLSCRASARRWQIA